MQNLPSFKNLRLTYKHFCRSGMLFDWLTPLVTAQKLAHGIVPFPGGNSPERASIKTLQLELEFKHVASGVSARAKLSILVNQLVVWIYSDHEWDVHD